MTATLRTPLCPAGHLPRTGGDHARRRESKFYNAERPSGWLTRLISPHAGGPKDAGSPEGGKIGRAHSRHLPWLAFAVLALLPTPALAHLDPAAHGSLAAGLSHPLFGLDHILAMVAVGLWSAMLGGRAVWLVPAAFVGTMLVGFAIALAGIGLPFVEPVIAASVVVLGLLTLVALQVPTLIGMIFVGFFALFHGYAHGGELGEAGALQFCAGFALSTALLHAVGIGLGLGLSRAASGGAGRWITRLAGGMTALVGFYMVAGG